MKSLHPLFIGLVAVQVFACVPKGPLPEASFPAYAPPNPDASASATIKGVYDEGTELLGAPASFTYLLAIDGHASMDGASNAPLPITAGTHSIVLGFNIGKRRSRVPGILNAKPGASYVIKRERGELTKNAYSLGGPGDILWIEDEKTGVIAMPKTSSIIFDNMNRYVPPTGPALSTISGMATITLIERTTAYVQMVDGNFVDGDAPASIFEGEHARPEFAVPILPGLHAIALDVAIGPESGSFPIMFDVKPNMTYEVKYGELVWKKWNNEPYQARSFWIEDAKTGAIVYPVTDTPAIFMRKF